MQDIKNIIANCEEKLTVDKETLRIYNPRALQQFGFTQIEKLPFSIIILLEQVLRNYDGKKFRDSDIKNLASWSKNRLAEDEIPFMPSRVVLQDFTGVPSLVDLAALRSTLADNNLDANLINPKVPVDLIIDHSIQVDQYASEEALTHNMKIEFIRNQERYEFLKWGQSAFKNFRVFPPGAGIIHQVNLEYLSPSVHVIDDICLPDTLVGTDSHTTMINGLGVLGWGVGGIEAESVMLGQPIYMKIPEVLGVKFVGKMQHPTTATDLVLHITEVLRKKGVVEKFVEFYGPGLDSLSLADRATIANMCPEYGATMAYFPVDQETLDYMYRTGRTEKTIEKAKAYYNALGIFRTNSTKDPEYSEKIEVDLSHITPSVAGPKRPQDRINLKDVKEAWKKSLTEPVNNRGFALSEESLKTKSPVKGEEFSLEHGSIVIAAITSCTNTSNPKLLITAGLLAKKAINLGLKIKPWVKTSLAPGSRVVTDYLSLSGLQEYLDQLGFNVVGYGCTTCIGNSGPLNSSIEEAIIQKNLVVCSVLSGNRNFEGRVHGSVKANFLASPPLVIAYALVGNLDIDIENEALGEDPNGKKIFLKDIWPKDEEVHAIESKIDRSLYNKRYGNIEQISPTWNSIHSKEEDSKSSGVFNWNGKSTYIQRPPFFDRIKERASNLKDIRGARVLLKLGDSVTTDHISPAGSFSEKTPAGQYLLSKNITKVDFNSYGSRRGNDKIMERGTFANIRINNQLIDKEGGYTKHFPSNQVMTVFEAAQKYKATNTPSIILAGAEYGSGSSRDWAAKGPYLLGVVAVIAVSFERIHRSNLIGMGVLPLQFNNSQDANSLNISGEEFFDILDLSYNLLPKKILTVKANTKSFSVLCRLDTEIEIEYYKNGGILHTVLKNIMQSA